MLAREVRQVLELSGTKQLNVTEVLGYATTEVTSELAADGAAAWVIMIFEDAAIVALDGESNTQTLTQSAPANLDTGVYYEGYYAITTPSCNDPRVTRGFLEFGFAPCETYSGVEYACAQYAYVPIIGFSAGDGPQGSGYTTPTKIDLEDGDLAQYGIMVENFKGGQTPGNHSLVVDYVSGQQVPVPIGTAAAPVENTGPVCINNDGTSCGAVFYLDNEPICQ